jgi:hypothetical protein
MLCVYPTTITSVDRSDEANVIATLVSAFIADPVERWLFAEPLRYLTQFARFVAAFGSGGFENKTVFSLGDFAAVAIWIPPGAEPDADAIVAVLSESVPTELQADTFSVLEQMDAAHPKDLHWYLPWLGVDSARQGAGLGAELLNALSGSSGRGSPAGVPRNAKSADCAVLRAPRICRDQCFASRGMPAGDEYAALGTLSDRAPSLARTQGRRERVAPLGVNAGTSNPVVARSGTNQRLGFCARV